MNEAEITASGQCLCGAVRYQVRGPLRPIIECHCKMCRQFAGGPWSYTAARPKDVSIEEAGALAWYESSDYGRRGFCRACGSSLFFKPGAHDRLSISAGTLDEPTNLSISIRMFTDSAGDYYEIGDNSVPCVGLWVETQQLEIPE